MTLMLAPKVIAREKISYEPRIYIHFNDTIREANLNFNGGIVLVAQHPRYEFLDKLGYMNMLTEKS